MKMKKMLCALLTLCMLLAMLPVGVMAADEKTVDSDIISLDTAALRSGVSRPTMNAPEDSIWIEDDEYLCYEDAWDALQVGMIYRRSDVYVNVYLDYTSEETLEDEVLDLAVALAAEALAHRSTSDFNTGDYLAWNVQDLSVELSEGLMDDTYAYVTLHYMATYLTTWEQEEAMDEALMDLMRTTELGEHFADGDAIHAVYDYVTSNVTLLSEVTDPVQHSAYGALINGEASPIGVVLLTYYLSYQCGVPCRIISGTVGEYTHVWNIAALDGLYYNLDACMDAGADEYSYFMVCPDNFTDHVRDEEYDTAEFHADHPMAEEDFHLCSHTFDDGEITEEPTCTKEGYKVYTCTGCGKTYGESVPMVDHSYDEGVVTQEPSCDDYGRLTYTCTVCGDSYYENIAMLEHQYDEGEVSIVPTCAEDGSWKYTCTVCGCSYFETVPALGHSYESVVTESTCTTDGSTTYTCTACGDTYTEVIPALGHTPDAGTVTIEPTCTEEGESAHPCTVCGEIITEVLPALGHSWDEGSITNPTCTEEGYTTYTCSVCFETEVRDQVPALGHTKNEGVVTQEATCTEPGVMSYVCTVCEAEFTEEIATLPHDYVDGFCTVCGGAQMTVPTIVSCYSQSQTSVKITWSLSEGAEGYEIWRTTDREDEESWIRVKTVADGSTDRYTNQGLTEGVTYYYKVRAYATNSDGSKRYTDFSNVHYMPAAVVFDGPYSNSTFRIRLRWNEVDGAHGYQIWRKTDDSDYIVVKTIGDRGNSFTTDAGGTTAYSNTSLEAGQKYTYKIRAYMFTEDGRRIWGTFSDEVTVAVKPEAPTLSCTSSKAGRAKLTWDIPEGADGFQIWMATSADGTFSVSKNITSGETTSYTQYDLTSGQTYYFKIRAYSEGQYKLSYSEFSEVISVTIK